MPEGMMIWWEFFFKSTSVLLNYNGNRLYFLRGHILNTVILQSIIFNGLILKNDMDISFFVNLKKNNYYSVNIINL